MENIVELDELLSELERMILPQAAAKALRFAIDRSGVHNSVIYMDLLRVKEMLFQLLDNAVKYTEPCCSLSLTVV